MNRIERIQENETMVEELIRLCKAADISRRQRDMREIVN